MQATEDRVLAKSTKYRQLKGIYRWLFVASTLIGCAVIIFYMFHMSVGGNTFMANGYFYLNLALFIPLVFLVVPFRSKDNAGVPWYDALAAFLVFGISFWLFLRARDIQWFGWEVIAPIYLTVLSLILLLLAFEGARRVGGTALMGVCIFFAAFPLFAKYMPGPLNGVTLGFWRNITFHVLGTESLIGLPLAVAATLLCGFLVFAVVLQSTGGGTFFINLALGILGNVRGATAKVSVVSSALFGTISGSVVANVMTVGAFTIPAMKKAGYPSHYAGAIEACSSTGGVLMPPIMGAAAFVMAEFLGIRYLSVAIAAVIPSILYYFGLFVQADAYAAKVGIKGIPRSEMPSVWTTLKDGWVFIVGFACLLYFLGVLSQEAQAPWYASLVLFILSFTTRKTRLGWKGIIGMVEGVGNVMADMTALLAAVGTILGAFLVTGVAASLSADIVTMAAGDILLLLILAFIVSFVLGMGLPITACYVLLAILVAPAMVQLGLDPIASHMFILYTGMISFITPPVALGTYAACMLAGSGLWKTGLQAMRLGIVIYFIPFFFALNPALVMHGSIAEIAISFVGAAFGVYLIAAAIEGYIMKLGVIRIWARVLLTISGALIAYPETTTTIIGICLFAATVVFVLIERKIRPRQLPADPTAQA